MNVKIQINHTLPAAIYYNDHLRVNQYQINISMITNTVKIDEINIAVDRVRMFLENILADAVFITQHDMERAEVLKILGMNVTTVPDEPVDQIVGVVLYCKLNAIMENRIQVDSLNISSSMGDEVWYMHEDGDLLGPAAEDGWWHRSDISHHCIIEVPTNDNVVQGPQRDWAEFGLTWPDIPVTENSVVYANFSKNEN